MSDKLLKSALWYARHGWYVIPLHAPLMDGAACVGCSCEAWKRSEKYRDWLISKGRGDWFDPAYTCKSQGKHPRVYNWEDEATTDPAKISGWWHRWPDANVGIAAGKSGLVCLDLDIYQEGAGEFALVRDETETITNLTGGGGQHLIYRHPEGAKINNSDREFPDWVNVRAHGGQFVAPPSLHKSGAFYEWEDGYGPHQIRPLELPEKLAGILQGAETNGRKFQLTEQKVTPGKRHQTLLASGGALRNMGFSGAVIEAALLALNKEQFTQPKPPDEVRAVVDWILQKPAGVLPGNGRVDQITKNRTPA